MADLVIAEGGCHESGPENFGTVQRNPLHIAGACLLLCNQIEHETFYEGQMDHIYITLKVVMILRMRTLS